MIKRKPELESESARDLYHGSGPKRQRRNEELVRNYRPEESPETKDDSTDRYCEVEKHEVVRVDPDEEGHQVQKLTGEVPVKTSGYFLEQLREEKQLWP